MTDRSLQAPAPVLLPPDLFTAVLMNNVEICRERLTRGGDVNAVDAEDRTALHRAAKLASIDIGRLLIESGAQVNAYDHAYRTPLHVAISSSKPTALAFTKLLLAAGADIDFVPAEDPSTLRGYRTPFEHALERATPNVVALLVERHPHLLGQRTLDRETMLEIASPANRSVILAVQTAREVGIAVDIDGREHQKSPTKTFGLL